MVFWLKPELMPPGNKTAFDSRIDPKWMVTIANHPKERRAGTNHASYSAHEEDVSQTRTRTSLTDGRSG